MVRRSRRRAGQLAVVSLLRLVDLSLRHFTYRSVRRFLRATSPSSVHAPGDFALACRFGRTVNVLAGRAGLEDSCLRRSLVTWWLLRWRGVETEVRIGMKLGVDGVRAHAWLEQGGRPINDVDEIGRQYPIQYDDALNPKIEGASEWAPS
ncbi:hypothetical protein BH23GEM6_BH23GEM6_20150 [soil metagenome]